MSNTIELERTLLLKYIPDEIRNVQPCEMVDVYVPDDPKKHSQFRIRQNGTKFEITKKIPLSNDDASKQTETTITLSTDEYNCLVKASTKRVTKHRYKTTYNGYTMEVDIFSGDLEGLAVVDFEFESEEAMEAFEPPDFCLADITQETFIAGGVLAGKKYSEIEKELVRFNYSRISSYHP